MLRRWLLSLLLLCCAHAAWGASALEKDVLIMGTAPTWPPLTFVDPSGKLAGLDIDLSEELKLKLGREIKIVTMEFNALIPSLLTGKIDFIISYLSFTPERAKKIGYSRPYYVTPPEAFVVRTDAKDIAGMPDLAGKVITCTAGTTHNVYLESKKETARFKEIRPFSTTDEVLREVMVGRADVAYTDGNTVRKIQRNPDMKLKVAFRQQASIADTICIAMRKEDKDLQAALNEALNELEEEEILYELRVKYDLE